MIKIEINGEKGDAKIIASGDTASLAAEVCAAIHVMYDHMRESSEREADKFKEAITSCVVNDVAFGKSPEAALKEIVMKSLPKLFDALDPIPVTDISDKRRKKQGDD